MTDDRTSRRPMTDGERTIVRIVLLYPEVAPLCGAILGEMRNEEVRGFIARVIDALVAQPDGDARKIVGQVGVRPGSEIAEIAAEIHRRGGFKDPHLVMSEQRAVEMIEELMLHLDRRVIEQRLREVSRALDEGTPEPAAKALMTEMRVLVRALQDIDGVPTRRK